MLERAPAFSFADAEMREIKLFLVAGGAAKAVFDPGN